MSSRAMYCLHLFLLQPTKWKHKYKENVWINLDKMLATGIIELVKKKLSWYQDVLTPKNG